MKDQMKYRDRVDLALRGVVRDTLLDIAENGLPGAHHLYISFRTHFPGVMIPDHLSQKYPDEITIVVQHQYWNLTVSEDSFAITLSFGGINEVLSVPFAALTGFVDPSVRFGLQFEIAGEGNKNVETLPGASAPKDDTEGAEKAGAGETDAVVESAAPAEKVVALDQFRKNTKK